MEKFNDVVHELCKVLPFCYQDPDGKIWWYAGARKYLFELMKYAIGADILEKPSQEKQST